ncbi:MAG: SGNH/GDSL hydrolase family protein [SAR324 cluster bacterium]|nr:SGNH/GDSL hydrolase family protein [SAR324 cluster bacterium]
MFRSVKEFAFLSFFWVVTGILLPILLPLAWYTRRSALRLPEAGGDAQGLFRRDSRKTIEILVLGESTVAGVGVEDHQEGLGAAIAFHLSENTGCSVHWQVLGKNRIDILGVIAKLVPQIPEDRLDYLIICLGVNDTTGLTSLPTWRQRITELVNMIGRKSKCRVFFSELPPMGKFTALPQPLRWIMGLRASILNRALQQHAMMGRSFQLIPLGELKDPEFLAVDGYHPSKAGYFAWGKSIAEIIARQEHQNC